jgi:hypothetical protein
MFDLEKYLTQLKDEQMKKLEELNGKQNTDSTQNNDNDKNITTSFKFPITYLENKHEINENIINDLELVESRP